MYVWVLHMINSTVQFINLTKSAFVYGLKFARICLAELEIQFLVYIIAKPKSQSNVPLGTHTDFFFFFLMCIKLLYRDEEFVTALK